MKNWFLNPPNHTHLPVSISRGEDRGGGVFQILLIIKLGKNFSFNQHTKGIYRHCQQRLTAIPKLNYLSVQSHLLIILKITHLASKLTGISTPNLFNCVASFLIHKALTVTHDYQHYLFKPVPIPVSIKSYQYKQSTQFCQLNICTLVFSSLYAGDDCQ